MFFAGRLRMSFTRASKNHDLASFQDALEFGHFKQVVWSQRGHKVSARGGARPGTSAAPPASGAGCGVRADSRGFTL